MNNVRTNTKGMGINIEKLADLVLSLDERQESTAKAIEMIHILVGLLFWNLTQITYLFVLRIFRQTK